MDEWYRQSGSSVWRWPPFPDQSPISVKQAMPAALTVQTFQTDCLLCHLYFNHWYPGTKKQQFDSVQSDFIKTATSFQCYPKRLYMRRLSGQKCLLTINEQTEPDKPLIWTSCELGKTSFNSQKIQAEHSSTNSSWTSSLSVWLKYLLGFLRHMLASKFHYSEDFQIQAKEGASTHFFFLYPDVFEGNDIKVKKEFSRFPSGLRQWWV